MKKIVLSFLMAASVAFSGAALSTSAMAKDAEKASKHEKMRGGAKHDHSKHDGHDHSKHDGHDHGKHKGHEKHELKKEEKAAAPEAQAEAPAAEAGQ